MSSCERGCIEQQGSLVVKSSIQHIQSEIRALILEFCDLYDGDFKSEAVSLLLTKLRELSTE